MNDWISVDDTYKPRVYTRVLGLTTDCDGEPYYTLVHYNGSDGFLGIGGKADRDVTHWMYLPELPKEDK